MKTSPTHPNTTHPRPREEDSPPRRSSRDTPAVKSIHGRATISSSIIHREDGLTIFIFLMLLISFVSMLELVGTLYFPLNLPSIDLFVCVGIVNLALDLLIC
jgi:hypothetical protein